MTSGKDNWAKRTELYEPNLMSVVDVSICSLRTASNLRSCDFLHNPRTWRHKMKWNWKAIKRLWKFFFFCDIFLFLFAFQKDLIFVWTTRHRCFFHSLQMNFSCEFILRYFSWVLQCENITQIQEACWDGETETKFLLSGSSVKKQIESKSNWVR